MPRWAKVALFLLLCPGMGTGALVLLALLARFIGVR